MKAKGADVEGPLGSPIRYRRVETVFRYMFCLGAMEALGRESQA